MVGYGKSDEPDDFEERLAKAKAEFDKLAEGQPMTRGERRDIAREINDKYKLILTEREYRDL